MIKDKVSCWAGFNNLSLNWLPKEFKNLQNLNSSCGKKNFIPKKKKIYIYIYTIIPKGHSTKVKSSTSNMLVSKIGINFKSLPRNEDSNRIILVKLKRNVDYRGHVHFEPVKIRTIESLLSYLKANNHLYRDIKIHMENSPVGYHLQISETEDNKIYNYINRNTTQPLDIYI